jgi:hypothetical protein
MRYLLSSHGCYVKDKKVDLKDVTLLFYAEENECIIYGKRFLKGFCNESINKRKEYKPRFKKRGEYFQMEYSREVSDKSESYIYCCNTKERIYDFKNGDLLLSQVIDLITLHNNSESPIYLSLLTCNSECSDEGEEYGQTLHRKRSFKRNYFPATMTNKNRAEKRLVSKSVRRTIPSLQTNTMKRRHLLKSGDFVLYNGKKVQVVKKGKWFSVDGEELNRKLITYIPDIEVGQTVMVDGGLWTVEESNGPTLSIRNLRDRRESQVETKDAVPLEI